jgi:hypothetical protein
MLRQKKPQKQAKTGSWDDPITDVASGGMIWSSNAAARSSAFRAALAEAQKEAKKAREQGLDAKTFQAVLRDKAKRR